ncbi:MAG TPA: hypothetical protein VNP04_14290 [Alphaproteobacteria bacterium]|nr:hypothetical protein [Alphaproteobacteria bacterium]
MSSLMDGVFIKRRCYLKLGDGTVLGSVRLRADCFFRHWPLKDATLDDEGWVRVRAVPSLPRSSPIAEVLLHIDPMTGLLMEYRYIDDGVTRIFTLVEAEYREVSGEGNEHAG